MRVAENLGDRASRGGGPGISAGWLIGVVARYRRVATSSTRYSARPACTQSAGPDQLGNNTGVRPVAIPATANDESRFAATVDTM
ncbi:hypothetical protein [Actinoplanes sp. RD1]|uniref:hypothetical protein n=1 Tax=Actinoplanes sp. RD1 TaxID=3064538 RepID=UPI00274192AA|nr:hypothetical protein [Actinoplanes sp. RD1]